MREAACGIFLSEVVIVKFRHEEVESILFHCLFPGSVELPRNFDQVVAECEPDTKLFIEASGLNEGYVCALMTFLLMSLEFRVECWFDLDGLRERLQGVLNDDLAVDIAIEFIDNLSILVLNLNDNLLLQGSVQEVQRMSRQFSQVLGNQSLLGEIVLDESAPECSLFDLLLRQLLDVECEELGLDRIETVLVGQELRSPPLLIFVGGLNAFQLLVNVLLKAQIANTFAVLIVAGCPFDFSDLIDLLLLHQVVDDVLLVNLHVIVWIVESIVPERLSFYLPVWDQLRMFSFICGEHPDKLPNFGLHSLLFSLF